MSLSLSRKRRSASDAAANTSSSSDETQSRPKRAKTLDPNLSQLLSEGNNELNRCGKILRIHLVNFMCHSNLSIDFDKNINFLIGSNGSGKSAVLAALVLGLGAKAKATNRSSSLKQFIKSGANSCKIEITFSNKGLNGYESYVYGDSITVVRTITQSSSTYAIKNAWGNVVSRKADDLNKILIYHNIQVDNTSFVLNQDSAREYLKELDPYKNYKIFLKATQMELVIEKLNECNMAHKEQVISLKIEEKRISELQAQLMEKKERLNEIISAKTLKNDIQRYEAELLWLQVTDLEKEMENLMEQIRSTVDQKRKLENRVNNRESQQSAINEKIESLKIEIVQKSQIFNKENDKCTQIKTKLSELHQRSMEVTTAVESLKRRVNHYTSQVEDIKTHIQDRSKQNYCDIAETRERNQASLRELRLSDEENRVLILNAHKEINQIMDKKLQKLEESRRIQNSIANVKNNYAQINRQIQAVQNTTKDKLALYGEHIPVLVNEIRNYMKAGQFSKMPRGPIGSYIEVTNSNYRDVVEQQLSGLLKAFIVNNKQDCIKLEEIFRKKFPNVQRTIITTKFYEKVYDVSKGKVLAPPGTVLLMDQIKCRDAVVMNCLIDRAQVETILLTNLKSTAECITANQENVPRNFQKIIIPQHGLEYYPEPHYRVYSIKIKPSRYIQVDIQQRIKQMESEKQSIEIDTQKLEKNLNDMKSLVENDIKLIKEKRLECEKLEQKKRDLADKISDLENYEYPEFNEVDILKRELIEIENKAREYEEKLSQKNEQMNELKMRKNLILKESEEQEKVKQAFFKEITVLKTKIEEATHEKRNVNDSALTNQKRILNLDDDLKKLETQRDQKEGQLRRAIVDATAKGERFESESTAEDIVDEIRRSKAKLKRVGRFDEDPGGLSDIIGVMEFDINMAQVNCTALRTSMEMLEKSVLTRFKFLRNLKQHMNLILQFAFSALMDLRNYKGEVIIDHEKKTLEIFVVPRDTHVKDSVASTKALSGGERSYTTVAFLLSLWTLVDHPFFFLDEYDVFTDEVNRKFITELLLNEGKRRLQRQFVYLTPLDMHLEPHSYIKIHRLLPPERKQ